MRVLVTGVAGFIGSRIAEAALAHDWVVEGIDDLSTGSADNVPDGAGLTVGDVRDPSAFPRGPFDVVYHCAASYRDRGDWERDASVNVLGTINAVRKARMCEAKVVYCQTSLCYGPDPYGHAAPVPLPVSARLDPHGSYAVSKTAGEAYIRDSGVPYVSLRLANIYGPRNLSGPVPAFYDRISRGKPCTVVDSRRDFVFVDDMVWVAVKAATQGSGVYHVSSGSDMAVVDIYRAVLAAMAIDEPPTVLAPRGPDDVATLLLDPWHTYEEFGWTAQTPLAEGVARAVAWYQEHGVRATYTHLAPTGAAR